MRKQIPNLFTLLNLWMGIIAVVLAVNDRLVLAAIFVFLGIFFDFFDGFFARKYNVTGEFGKQLDSLADMVTSGVIPGIVMFQLILHSLTNEFFTELSVSIGNWRDLISNKYIWIASIGFLISLASAFRLAKFNLDARQTDSFIGLPTPALSIFVVSLPIILEFSEFTYFMTLLNNTSILVVIVLLGAYLLNAELPLFSLKFKNFGFNDNKIRYVFLALCLMMVLLLQIVAIPLVIILYISLSIVDKIVTKKKVY